MYPPCTSYLHMPLTCMQATIPFYRHVYLRLMNTCTMGRQTVYMINRVINIQGVN
ncbi:unnamed protein product [Callosobruchus maculatus]|uniref:Uncharacterized protein n=1 Tax=Callosobruchus maculatus TaxID=64391 RepID=A0A653DRY8_CALMS|nr:unnamed protein product [Callosobruchus maculatus]